MEKKNILIFTSIILCCTVFLFILSQVTVLAFAPFRNNDTNYLAHTSIGPVNISNLDKSKSEETLNTRIIEWKSKNKAQLSFLNKKIDLPNNVFEFNFSDTFQSIQNGKENQIFVEINNNELANIFRKLGMTSIMDKVNMSKLKSELDQYASNLSEKDLSLNMEQYLIGFDEYKQTTISSDEIPINNQDFIHYWLKEHQTVTIKPNSLFSFQKIVNDKDINEDANFNARLSSAIYMAILQTNLQVVERNISQIKPNNIQLGFEANVQKDLDLKIYNPNSYEIKIVSKKVNSNKIQVKIIGPKNPLQYAVVTENENSYPERTITEYVPSQNMERKVKGKKGYSIDVYKEIYWKQTLLERELVSNDFYLPKDDIEYKSVTNNENSVETDNTPSNETRVKTEINLNNDKTENGK